MISGGSSSGSAVAVALGMAAFALGTDTAGSGRVPAMLNISPDPVQQRNIYILCLVLFAALFQSSAFNKQRQFEELLSFSRRLNSY